MKSGDSENWQVVGMIGVDAGLCWVGDPCYCVTPDADCHPAKTWGDFCSALERDEKDGVCQWKSPAGYSGLGVSVSTGYGDGQYPVLIRRNAEGRIAEVRVIFDDIDGELEDRDEDYEDDDEISDDRPDAW